MALGRSDCMLVSVVISKWERSDRPFPNPTSLSVEIPFCWIISKHSTPFPPQSFTAGIEPTMVETTELGSTQLGQPIALWTQFSWSRGYGYVNTFLGFMVWGFGSCYDLGVWIWAIMTSTVDGLLNLRILSSITLCMIRTTLHVHKIKARFNDPWGPWHY